MEQHRVGRTVPFLTGVPVLLALVSDVLALTQMSFWTFVVFGILLIIYLFALLVTPIEVGLRRVLPGGASRFLELYRGWPLIFLLAFGTGVSFLLHQLTVQNEAGGGLLASQFKVVQQIQGQLGVIESELRGTRRAVESIDQRVGTLKRETSDNPRKELANRGIAFSADSYAEALRRSDLDTIDLFLQGGMDIYATEARYNQPAVQRMLHLAPTENSKKSIEFLLARGLDPNSTKAARCGYPAKPCLLLDDIFRRAAAKKIEDEGDPGLIDVAILLLRNGANTLSSATKAEIERMLGVYVSEGKRVQDGRRLSYGHTEAGDQRCIKERISMWQNKDGIGEWRVLNYVGPEMEDDLRFVVIALCRSYGSSSAITYVAAKGILAKHGISLK